MCKVACCRVGGGALSRWDVLLCNKFIVALMCGNVLCESVVLTEPTRSFYFTRENRGDPATGNSRAIRVKVSRHMPEHSAGEEGVGDILAVFLERQGPMCWCFEGVSERRPSHN